MLLSIIDDKRKLIPALLILYILLWELSGRFIFPLEANLGWEISQHASILFLPAGVIFLSFYLLRWWFIPIVLIGRTYASFDNFGDVITPSILIENIFICLVYPLWLHLLNSANWDVFGDKDHNALTITGAMIFQSMVTFTISFGSTIQQITFGTISWNESTQYVMHFIIGDVIGTGIVIFAFYQFMRVAVAMSQRNNG
ncbi:hypothetical protein N9W31_00365 [Litoricolaceae bacterium]|nr:hypothetical protein [Litorivicinaceae bacterium]